MHSSVLIASAVLTRIGLPQPPCNGEGSGPKRHVRERYAPLMRMSLLFNFLPYFFISLFRRKASIRRRKLLSDGDLLARFAREIFCRAYEDAYACLHYNR